jgi:ATP-dependent DNA ligase
MLAQRYDKVRHPDEYYLQYKYDGNRCLIIMTEDGPVAYSRKGKVNNNLEHILSAVPDLPVGTILDGELYCHNVPLQTLRSWIARKQPNTERLKYHCYDLVKDSLSYAERYEVLRSFDLPAPIELVPTVLLAGAEASPERLSARMSAALADGYEGLILRLPDGKYETGKRSKTLIKVKRGHLKGLPMEEEEFLIIDIEPSKDGWARLVCSAPFGEFRVSAPGDMAAKYKVMINKELYIGKFVTVEFPEYTQDGIPFQPVALAFRDHHD